MRTPRSHDAAIQHLRAEARRLYGEAHDCLDLRQAESIFLRGAALTVAAGELSSIVGPVERRSAKRRRLK